MDFRWKNPLMTQSLQVFDLYQLIDRIRPRPALYLGDHSIVRLQGFLAGCFVMAMDYKIECTEQPTFRGFSDWTAKHFGRPKSTAGWCTIILQECSGDERKALDHFFELIEEFKAISS